MPDTLNITAYNPFDLNEPRKSAEFLIRHFGFERVDGKDIILLKNAQGNILKLALNGRPGKRPVIELYSNDCLHDYIKLKWHNIHFALPPQYTQEGLTAEFTDPYGNRYKVIEKRIYVED